MALQHLRSSTANKRPIPTVMSAGQIAINTNEASPGVFFKDTNGNLVKVGPVHVGENAPNSSPASVAATALVTDTVYQILTVGTSDFTLVGASANTVGTIFTATGTTTGTGTVSGQQGVEKGEQWLDTTGGTYVLKIYDGSAWRSESGTFVDVNGDTMTGALGVVAGSASAPGVFFSGDTNTGLLSPGADSVAITTGGTQRIVVDSSGRVGINNASLTARVDIVGSPSSATTASSDTQLALRNTNPNRAAYINFTQAAELSFYNTGGGTSNATTFNNGFSERLRIDSSGNVGIGTTSPAATLHLNKSGTSDYTTLYLSNSGASGKSYQIGVGGNTAGAGYANSLYIYDNSVGQPRAVLDSSGNVGIGTLSPSSALDVSGAISFGSVALPSAGTARIYSRNTDNALYLQTSSGNRISFLDGSQNSMASFEPTVLKFFISNTERARFDSSGRLGLGTSSPSSLLHVSGQDTTVNISGGDGSLSAMTSNTSQSIAFQGGNTEIGLFKDSSGNYSYVVGTYQGSVDIPLVFRTGNRAERMRIDSSGNVGIGNTSPGYKLSVLTAGTTDTSLHLATTGGASANGDATNAIRFTGGTNTRWANAKYEAFNHIFHGNGVEQMRIDSSGRIGVGTSSPADTNGFGGTLDLSGSVGGAFYIRNQSNASHYGLFGFYDTDIYVTTHADGNIRFNAGSSGTERARIDSSGRLLINHTADTAPAGYASKLQLCDTSYQGSSLLIRRDQNSGSAPALVFAKTRSSTKGGNTIVQNGDLTGQILFFAGDGNDANALTAYIASAVDGTPGSNDMPGRLTFHTTADGATASTERMRIQQSGQIYLSNCTDFYPLSDNSTGLGGAVNRWTAVYAANGTIQTSDSRQKTSVVDAQLGANFIKALRPVSYKWIEGGKRHTGEYDEDNNWVYETVPGQRTHWGFIAQEVKQAVDDAGVDFGGWVLTDKDDPDSEQALRYDQFIAPLTKALQEAIAKIETLEQRLSDAGIA